MALLASATYDPAVAVTKATTSALALTALDTTNLRVTFTVPANGTVLVRMLGLTTGSAAAAARNLFGVLEGATVRGRVSNIGYAVTGTATNFFTQEAVFVVSGLTPGNSATWDAAYAVQASAASTNIKYGGPNDNSGGDAWGAFVFEVWDAVTILASTLYDPSTAATLSGTSLLAMTAMDTTNLRLTFTAPSSGTVFWRIRIPIVNGTNTAWGSWLLGILDGTTVRGRVSPLMGIPHANAAAGFPVFDASGIVTGLSGSYTWDASYAVQTVEGAGGLKYGGPNNNSGSNAWGGVAYEIWAA